MSTTVTVTETVAEEPLPQRTRREKDRLRRERREGLVEQRGMLAREGTVGVLEDGPSILDRTLAGMERHGTSPLDGGVPVSGVGSGQPGEVIEIIDWEDRQGPLRHARSVELAMLRGTLRDAYRRARPSLVFVVRSTVQVDVKPAVAGVRLRAKRATRRLLKK